MRLQSSCLIYLGLIGLTLGAYGCKNGLPGQAKSDDDKSEETPAVDPTKAGVTEAAGDNLLVAGQLALTPLALSDAATPNKVLVWIFDDRGFEKTGDSFDVAADGTFTVDVPRKGMIDLILSAKKEDGTFDKDVLAKLFPEHAAEIAEMTDADLDAEVAQMRVESEKRGGHMVVLTSIDDTSGSKLDQAETIRFVGLPGKSGNMSAWPVKNAKGNLTLGKIVASGTDEATAELPADANSFDLDEDAVASLTSAGSLLKSLRNVYVNGDTYRAEPFFQFMSTSTTPLAAGDWSSPDDLVASRSGFYLAVRGTDKFTWSELCSETKVLEFVPPTSVETDNGTRSPTSPYNSKGTSPGTQGDDQICTGGATGIYMRPDSEDGRDMMVNWSLKGSAIPDGWWHLKVGGETVGSFDLGTSNPVDDNGNPKVFIPKAKVDVDGDGKITKVSMVPTFYNAETDSMVELQDLRAFRQLTSEVTFSLSGENGAELRGFLNCPTTGNVCEGTHLMGEHGEGPETPLTTAALSYPADGSRYLTISYKIGSATFRTELRQDMSGQGPQ